MRTVLLLSVILSCPLVTVSSAADPLFSGPQVGEPLTEFTAIGVLGKTAGKKMEVLRDVKKDPVLLIFVHKITRPSIGLLRMITNFAKANKDKKKLHAKVIFLAKDRTEMEATIRRARHALPPDVPPMISVDGAEGPGAYGLNRQMTLTVLVGNEGKVTANFPLIQPSVQADGPKIGLAMVKATGGSRQPTLQEMGAGKGMMARRDNAAVDGMYRRLMRPVIQKQAKKEEVDEAARQVEAMADKNGAFRAKVGKAASLITNSDRLSNYGTIHAQEYLKKWAKLYGKEPEEAPKPKQTAEDAAAPRNPKESAEDSK